MDRFEYRRKCDDAHEAYQASQAGKEIDPSRVAAYLSLQATMGDSDQTDKEQTLAGFRINGGKGAIRSPLPSLDELYLRSDR